MQNCDKKEQIYIVIPKSTQERSAVYNFAENVVRTCRKSLEIGFSLLLDNDISISILNLKPNRIQVEQIQRATYIKMIPTIFVNSDNFVCKCIEWDANNKKFIPMSETVLSVNNIITEDFIQHGKYFPVIGTSMEQNTPLLSIFIPKSILE
jgi:hypothetical protein